MHTDHDILVNIFDEQRAQIVKLELSDVIKRVIMYELPGSFEIEAVKAFAVAVRTAVVKRLKMFDGVGCEKHRGADICTGMKGFKNVVDLDTLKMEVGDNFESNHDLINKAVEGTSGIIITFGGRPIAADYHIACGGGTENS